MSCLKLQLGTLKQCLLEQDGHVGDCVFTLLKPEVAAAQDKRKERDNQLVRRQVAQGFIPTILAGTEPEHMNLVVDAALVLADELIVKTGGFGP